MYLGSRVGCEDDSSRCGLTLQFSCFLHHAEVGDRNPVRRQLDQVVVDGVDDNRHWMRQYSAKLEVTVQLPLTQQVDARVFRCSVWGQVESKQLVPGLELCQTQSTVDAVGLQPCFYKQSFIGSDDVPGCEVGLDMELLIVELNYNISHVVVVEIVRVLCFSSRTRRFLHETEHHISWNLSRVRKVEGVLQ